LHNPIKIAEEAATADILSDGRLEFGVGRGVAYQYPSYGIPLEESRERFEEALDFILEAWAHELFSFEGKYFRARNLSVVPRPVQSPHPPVRIAANSPDTFPFSGRRKLPIFASPLINPPDKLKAGLAIYRDTLAGTPGDTALAFPVHVTTSRAQARQDCEAGLMRFLRVAVELVRPKDQSDFKSFEAFRQVLARFERVKYEDFDREIGVFGDPDYCVERVRALQREYGIDEFICYFNQGGMMDHAMVRRSMTAFAREVMPHCR
jgi:alkanesulfonate monooxygenase SsuD/methylene tetrahydromethanopterin reductase-like flavin-dependent oxidoreductase (luciferase family)